MEIGTLRVKTGLAEMLKGGVIMDVTTADQARIAEDAGACAVMALERVPADIRAQGGVARMADPDKIREIQEAVTIPVMAKARIGHFVEAQMLEALEVDYIDESEVLTPADTAHHIDKWNFTVPFVCGCTNLGEALRRIAEGAAMIRTKGEAGTGDIVNAVTHMRSVFGHIRRLQSLREEELFAEAKELRAPYELDAATAVAARRGALRRGEGAACAVRAREVGRRERPAAGRDVHGRRHRDSGRRGALHAARRRRRVRRLGHLQVDEPGRPREGDRRGDDALRGRRGSRARLAGSRRRDERPLHGDARSRRAARDPGLVMPPRVGVLAVQGNFREHAAMLRRLGADVVEVRKPEQLDGLDGLVIPGGESTTFMRLMRLYGLDEAVRRFGGPILGTCAGMIVLDRNHLGLVDVEVERNAWGRQVHSFEADLDVEGEDAPLRGVFIRAPWISEAGPGVEILAEHDGHPVLAREGRVLVAAFHPELTDDTRVHERFLELVEEERHVRA